jgi:DNA-binding SARP family transcriptional activator/predicted ATPase
VPPVRIELLGNLRITVGRRLVTSVNTSRLQSLLAFLVLHGGAPQSREHLASVLWPESNGSQARTNLRQLLHQLRRALPECVLLTIDNHTVCWQLDNACSIDVIEFETAAAQAANAENRSALAAAREALEEAVRIYQHDLLPGLYDEWLEPRRAQLRQQLAEVLARLAASLETTGEYPAAIFHATRLLALDPLREPSYQLLMRLHGRNNDRTSAIRIYHQCMRVLRRELGVSPSQTTQDLFNQALKSEHPPAAALELPPHTATGPAMVGRTPEWERLLGCWRQAARGEAHFALILGEPGIGKSRLADELFRHCVRAAEGAVARARCYFAQGRLAYGPVVDWLRSDSWQPARTHLPKHQLAELARVLPEILVDSPEIAPPQPLTESWQRRHLYEALNAGFNKGPKPLLLLIDDLQWCDPDSFEWLHFFFRSEASANTLVLGTARPEGMGRDHPLTGLVGELRQSGQMSEFPLAPLTIEETSALAAQVAGQECESGFVSGLYQTTKGNPLFVVESVRSSVEDDAASKSRIPPRVQAVIAGRLAQLSQPAFEVVAIAAVVGRPFSLALLAKATDLDEDSLSQALEELWQRRIIDGQDAATYDYTHDLLREVAYTELSPVRRRSLHKRVATALEELHAQDLDPVAGWLAAHYQAAGLAEQAIQFYRAAASIAKHRFAEAEAADLLRTALLLCRDFPESPKRDQEELELLATLGPSLVVTRGYSSHEVGETYSRGLRLAKPSGDRKHLFSMLSGAWTFHLVRGQLEESRRLAQDFVDNAKPDDLPAIEMTGRFLLGTSLFHQGQLLASREQIEQAVPALMHASHPALALFAAGPNIGVFCKSYLSHVLWHLGDAGLAKSRSHEAVGLARELSDSFCLAFALDYAAMLDVFRQDAESALAHATEASAICRKYGFSYYLAWTDILAGWATAVVDDPVAGLSRLNDGLVALRATGGEIRLPFYYGLVAEACGLAGETREALANIDDAFAFENKNGELWFSPELHRIRGDVLARAGDSAGAQMSYRCAVESARQIGAKAAEQRAAAHLQNLHSGKTQTQAAERLSQSV